MSEPATTAAATTNITYLAGTATTDALLATKLVIPPVRSGLVARPRLLARLDEALRCRLTVLSSSPGSGKTTLLMAWLASSGRLAAWVALDEGDNDPGCFWSYVISALERACPGSTGPALAMLRSMQAPPIQTVLVALLNALAGLRDDLLLVLDDYHAIAAQPIHDALTYLLDYLPPRLHLVLASRSEPPLPLARLRARGQLGELHTDDLRFTPEEAAAFLVEAMGLALTPAEVALLETRTEGWAVGLQLAALSLRGRDDVAAFLTAFTGSHRYIVDYLTDEVLERQPEELRTFLLQTSILDRLSAPLCDAVTGMPHGQAFLRQLEQANVFLMPLDEQRRWYRYHRLFADALRERLRQTEPDLLLVLHQRAGAWLEASGALEEAVVHVLATGDIAHAAVLAEQGAAALWKRSEAGPLRRWLKALPDAVIRARSWLQVYQIWARFVSGQVEADERLLDEVERTLSPDLPEAERRALIGSLVALRAFIAHAYNDSARAERLAREALALLPDGELSWRSLTAICLGHAAYARGDLAAAYQAYEEAATAGDKAHDDYMALAGTLGMTNIQEERAEPHAAYATLLRALNRFTRLATPALPALGYVEAGLGALACEWNQLEEAEKRARRAWDYGKRGAIMDLEVNSPLHLATIYRIRGEYTRALEMVAEAERPAPWAQLPWFGDIIGAWKARIWLAQGDHAAAERWAQSVAGSALLEHETERTAWPVRTVLTTLVRVSLTLGRPDEALAALAPLRVRAERTGQTLLLIETCVLQALAWYARADTADALAALERALTLAQPGGYLHLFVDEGEPMAKLFVHLRESRGHALGHSLLAYLDTLLAYLDTLLAAVHSRHAGAPEAYAESADPSLSPSAQPPGEPLTEREREVLALVAAGASNDEIAVRMVISIHTVKTHLTHIFGKLGAASRTQAVAHARHFGLL